MQVPTAIEAIPVISWNEAGWWDSGVIWLPRAQRIEKIFLYPDDIQIWLRKDGALEWISPESESKVLLCELSHPQTEL